jgi:uncharacterized protein YybS (DUF2232 family)
MQSKRLSIIVFISLIILLVPFVAMQFTKEVNWTFLDFVIAGILLIGTGLMIDFTWMKVKKSSYRIAIIIAILLVLLLVWAELAVGIFGSPFSGN